MACILKNWLLTHYCSSHHQTIKLQNEDDRIFCFVFFFFKIRIHGQNEMNYPSLINFNGQAESYPIALKVITFFFLSFFFKQCVLLLSTGREFETIKWNLSRRLKIGSQQYFSLGLLACISPYQGPSSVNQSLSDTLC